MHTLHIHKNHAANEGLILSRSGFLIGLILPREKNSPDPELNFVNLTGQSVTCQEEELVFALKCDKEDILDILKDFLHNAHQSDYFQEVAWFKESRR